MKTDRQTPRHTDRQTHTHTHTHRHLYFMVVVDKPLLKKLAKSLSLLGFVQLWNDLLYSKNLFKNLKLIFLFHFYQELNYIVMMLITLLF